jgi:hypothetical protein
MAFWSFPEFEADPEKMKNRPSISIDRLFVQPIIQSIDFQSTQLRSIQMRSIDSQSTIFSIDRLHIFQKVMIFSNLCAIQIKS